MFVRASVSVLGGVLLACGIDVTEPDGGSTHGATSGPEATEGSTSRLPHDETTVASAADADASVGPGGDTGASTSEGTAEGQGTGEDSTGAPPANPWCDATDPDLIACYDLQAVGQIANGQLPDGSSHANDGVVHDVAIVAGPLGHALHLQEDSVVSVPDSESLNLTQDMSFEVFVRVDAAPRPGTRMGILDNDWQYSIFLYPDTGLRCDMYGVSVFAPLPSLGEWFHVACVLQDGIHEMYIDGVSVGETPFTVIPDPSNTEPMAIGNDSPSWNDPLLGAIGGVRVWARPLDDEEVCRAAGSSCRR